MTDTPAALTWVDYVSSKSTASLSVHKVMHAWNWQTMNYGHSDDLTGLASETQKEIRKEMISDMKKRFMSIALLVAVMAFAFGPMVSVQAAPPVPALSVPVTGSFTDAQGGTGTFVGDLAINRFAVQNGELVAIGTLTGTLTDSLGIVLGSITQAVTLPVTAQATCEILDLELGPLDLDLLGLMVHLDRINLEITAQEGGGLLGDLLCSIADLLNNNSSLNALARLLNNILRILG